MDRQDIANQIRFEQELLRHAMEGLRLSTTWHVRGSDASRKLSTLRFVVGAFQRHLERLFALEEDDGFMDKVLSSAPRFGRMMDTLRTEHEQFRGEARRLVLQLERLQSTDLVEVEQVGSDVVALVDKIERHNRKEIALVQEAFVRDEGGEG